MAQNGPHWRLKRQALGLQERIHFLDDVKDPYPYYAKLICWSWDRAKNPLAWSLPRPVNTVSLPRAERGRYTRGY